MTVDIAVLAIRIDSTDTQVATKKLDQLRETGSRTERSIAGLEATARSAAGALKLLATVVGANEIIKQADLWASLEGRLRLVTNTERQMMAVRQQLYDMSQRTRGELEGTVDLYAKLTRSTQNLGTTEAQRLRVTESINKMMVISSATSLEAGAAIRQLGQAMGSGVLRGDELNRILESAPRLAEAIAAGMGRSSDEVRAMGAAGEITSKALVDSLLTQSQAIDDEFGKMPKVVGQAMVQIQNSFLRTVGVFDQTNQLSANLADTLSLVAENMGVLAAGAAGLAATAGLHWVGAMVVALRTKIAVTTAAIVADRSAAATAVAAAAARVAETGATVAATTARLAEVRAATLAATGNVQLALTTNALIPAQVRATAAATAHAAALAAQAAAGAGAAGVAGWGARALGMLGGPIGIVTTLLGLGATAWMMWGQKAEQAEKDVEATLSQKTEEIIAELDKQIKKLEERNRLMGIAPALAKAEGPGAEQQRAIMAEINRIAKDETIIAAAKTEQLRVLGGQYNELTEKMVKAAQGQAQLDTALKGDKRAKWLLDNSQYMTDAQKLAAAIAKAKTDLGDAYSKADEAMITAKFNEQNIKKAASAFNDAKKSANEFIESLMFETAQAGLNASQMRMMTAAREAAKAPEAGQRMRIMQLALAREIAGEAAESQAQAEKLANEALDKSNSGINEINEQTKALLFKVKTYGMLPEAITAVQIAELEAAKQSLALTDAGVADIQRRIDALKGLAAAQAADTAQDKGLDVTKAKELLDILVAVDQATKSAADGMAESFGRVGSAIGGLTTALSGYAVQQQAITAQLAAAKADPKNGPDKIAKLEIAAAHASAQAKIKSYGDMAGAAKGFFKENTKGYKVMEGAEKAFRAYEIALSVKNMMEKSGLLTAFTGLFVASKATQTVVEGASTAKSTAMAGAQASAWGITAVVKAIASLPFPLNLAAGAATLAAVVAIGASMMGGIGGGASSAPLSEERQKTQGTGTVLGDETAKSESIAKSLEMMEGYASLELEYQNSMLTALRNIEIALGGAAKGIMQTIGITGGSAFGTIASESKKLIGASHTSSITDSGVKFNGTFGQMRAGTAAANQYEIVRTESDGGMFRSGWTRDDPKYKALAEEAKRPFALIFDNMGDLLVDAGVKLGRDGASLTSAINSIGVNFEVSLRDLKGQELTDALNAGISVSFDKVTKELFPTIAHFQKMGEGLGETLVRVAADVQGVDSVFASMGKSLTTTVTRNMSSIGGWFTGIFNGVAQSVTVVSSMSLEAKERLVEASGGLEKFASSASSFMRNFYSEAEQNAATKARLQPVLATVGLSTEGPNAQKMFRDFVIGLDTSTASGRETYAMLMDVQQAFKDVTAAAADERTDLRKQLDQLTLTRAQLLERERSALDASNRGLWDQVQAAQKARDAQDAAKTSLGDFISKMGSFATSAKFHRDSMMVGSLSTLTPEQQYAELRTQYASTKAAALGGDTTAQGKIFESLTAYLTASQKINGGDAQYAADFASGRRDAEMMSQWAAGQVDVAQASLNALNDQVSGISTLNQTMLQMAQNIDNLPADLVATVAQAVLPVDYSRMGSSSNAELLAEVKALRISNESLATEVKGLRAEQRTQTGDTITGIATAIAGGAKTVVAGLDDANTSARSRDYQVNLNAY